MRIALVCLLLIGLSVSPVVAQRSWDTTAPVCQILDRSPDSVTSLGLTYIQESRFSGYGESRFLQVDGAWEVGYFRDVLLGDIDVALDFDGMLILSSADLQLPDQLIALSAEVAWTWRYVNGTALQVGATPGIYSDMEELNFRSFAVPLSVAGVMTLMPELSAIGGLHVRPGFERLLMPIAGVVWQPCDWLRVEATVPEARVLYHWDSQWSVHAGWAWESTTYSIREKGDYNRKKLSFESYRTAVGATYAFSDALRVTGEVGRLTERNVEFKTAPVGMDEEIDIHDEWFVRVGIGGPL